MPDLETEIRSRVESFVEELTVLVRQSAVDAAVNALRGSGGSVVKAGRGGLKASGSKVGKGKGNRRSPGQIKRTLSKVLAHVKAHEGARAEDVRKALKLTPTQTGDALTRLLKAKSIKSKGERRATVYSKA